MTLLGEAANDARKQLLKVIKELNKVTPTSAFTDEHAQAFKRAYTVMMWLRREMLDIVNLEKTK